METFPIENFLTLRIEPGCLARISTFHHNNENLTAANTIKNLNPNCAVALFLLFKFFVVEVPAFFKTKSMLDLIKKNLKSRAKSWEPLKARQLYRPTEQK